MARPSEKELGERLPVCPGCKSSYLAVAYTGPVVHALVNTGDPARGVQDVVVDPDVAQLDKVAWPRRRRRRRGARNRRGVRCAL